MAIESAILDVSLHNSVHSELEANDMKREEKEKKARQTVDANDHESFGVTHEPKNRGPMSEFWQGLKGAYDSAFSKDNLLWSLALGLTSLVVGGGVFLLMGGIDFSWAVDLLQPVFSNISPEDVGKLAQIGAFSLTLPIAFSAAKGFKVNYLEAEKHNTKLNERGKGHEKVKEHGHGRDTTRAKTNDVDDIVAVATPGISTQYHLASGQQRPAFLNDILAKGPKQSAVDAVLEARQEAALSELSRQ